MTPTEIQLIGAAELLANFVDVPDVNARQEVILNSEESMLPERAEALEAGIHYTPTGIPWVLVNRGADRTPAVYLWQNGSPYPDSVALQRIFRLTPTQARVAQMLANRRTNAEIAALLKVTIHTARRHVEAVLLRLDVRSRWEVEERVYKAAAGVPEGRDEAPRRDDAS